MFIISERNDGNFICTKEDPEFHDIDGTSGLDSTDAFEVGTLGGSGLPLYLPAHNLGLTATPTSYEQADEIISFIRDVMGKQVLDLRTPEAE